MAIINDDELLEDSLMILTEHFELSEPEAKEILNNREMAYIVNEMYQAQEQYISELYIKHKKEK